MMEQQIDFHNSSRYNNQKTPCGSALKILPPSTSKLTHQISLNFASKATLARHQLPLEVKITSAVALALQKSCKHK